MHLWLKIFENFFQNLPSFFLKNLKICSAMCVNFQEFETGRAYKIGAYIKKCRSELLFALLVLNTVKHSSILFRFCDYILFTLCLQRLQNVYVYQSFKFRTNQHNCSAVLSDYILNFCLLCVYSICKMYTPPVFQ